MEDRRDATLFPAMKIRVRYRDNRRELKQGTVRWFGISTTLLSMAAVALLSALLTVRIAIHAGEVEVPNVGGLTVEEAGDKTHDAQLNLTVENRFYSTTVPAGRVLSQLPAPGTSVRKGWNMRITESMGPQKAEIPDTIGMDQRDAASVIRRSQMDLGTVAHLPAPGPADVVLAQTPPPNAEGVDKPEVSLLLSQPFQSAPRAYVMPNLVGLSFTAARARMKEMNLPLWAIVPQSAPPVQAAGPDGAVVGDAAAPPAAAAPVIAGPIASQVPVAGARVSASDNPHVTMTRGYSAPAPVTGEAGPAGLAPTQPAAPIVRQPPPSTTHP